MFNYYIDPIINTAYPGCVKMCRTLCPTFQVKTSDIISKTSDMSGKKQFFIFTCVCMCVCGGHDFDVSSP